jgi:hypothetical protein
MTRILERNNTHTCIRDHRSFYKSHLYVPMYLTGRADDVCSTYKYYTIYLYSYL